MRRTAVSPLVRPLAEVVVRVTDVNEPPAFDRNVYPVSVSEDDSVGGVAVTLSASDPDDGQAVLLYEIISGNELGHFMIDNQTGVVYIAAVLDRESLDRYSLGVRVMGVGRIPTGVHRECGY